MKELSIEEKAKAYDVAIKRAKNTIEINQTIPDIVECVESLFPELKESEDERIRNRIIDLVNARANCNDVEPMISWLEKHSTPQVRTGLEWVNTIDDACDKRYLEEYAHGEYCHEQSFKWGFQEGVDWLEKQGEQKYTQRDIDDAYLKGISDAKKELEKQDKQKSIWSEEDSLMIDETIYFIDEFQKSDRCKNENDMQNSVTCKNWLKALKDRVGCEMNCTTTKEWSEEDIVAIDCAVEVLSKDLPSLAASIERLKSLRPQNPIDWTMQDEEELQIALDTLVKAEQHSSAKWLKNVCLVPQNHWKPTEEQMKILDEVLNFAANHESPYWNDYIFETLNNLIRQLKKL